MTAIIFVPLLVMTALMAMAVWVYLSQTAVVIVEETGAGNEQVVGSDEPFVDWIWQSFHLAWLVGVWIAPAILFGRVVTYDSEPYHRPLYIILHAAFAFWVAFPLSLLSTMSAESRFAILHFGLFQRLAKRLPSVLLFYVCTFLLVAVGAPALFWLGRGKGVVSLLVGALLVGGAILLYARLLGRLACLARLTQVRTKSKKKRRPQRAARATDPWEVPEGAEQEAAARSGGFVQPRELPALSTPDEEAATGYDVNFEHSHEPGPEESDPDWEESAPRSEADKEGSIEEEERRLQKEHLDSIKPDKVETEHHEQRRKLARQPEHPLLWGVGGFLFTGHAAIQWVVLSLGFALLGLLIRGLQEFWPE